MRRDSEDTEWQKVKEKVKARDRFCRLIKILTAKEFFILQWNAKRLINIVDPAHILPVSTHPSLVYDDENIILLNRYSHENLDNCKDPITGKPISRELRDSWWKRIIGEDNYTKLIVKVNDDNDGP